jgi:hypothetical protein
MENTLFLLFRARLKGKSNVKFVKMPIVKAFFVARKRAQIDGVVFLKKYVRL